MPTTKLPTLEALRTIIGSASALAEALLDHPLLARLVAVFDGMPEDDRETIVGVLEREVEMRRLLGARPGPFSGVQAVRANPHARLYLRLIESGEDDESADMTWDQIAAATTRSALTMARALGTDTSTHADWRRALLAGFAHVGDRDLDALDWSARTTLELTAEARAARGREPTS
jgi:hypothetical protein